MPLSSQLIMFCFTAFVLILTPGPNFVYVLTGGLLKVAALRCLRCLGWAAG